MKRKIIDVEPKQRPRGRPLTLGEMLAAKTAKNLPPEERAEAIREALICPERVLGKIYERAEEEALKAEVESDMKRRPT